VLRGSAANNTAADTDSIYCHLLVVTGADVHHQVPLESYQCLVYKPHEHGNQDGIDELKSVQVQVHLPESFVSEHRRFLSGINIPVLRITGGVYDDNGVLVVPEKINGESAVVITNKVSPHRRLLAMTGAKKVLSVRVVTNSGQEPQESFDDLRGRIMGTGPFPQVHTLRTQMKKCTFGAVDIQPADGNDGTGIRDGVVQVTVNVRIDETCNILGACQEDIRRQTENQIQQPLQNFDFAMFCLPDGAAFGPGGVDTWAAFAYRGGNVSINKKAAITVDRSSPPKNH
jgi:hypothetical protein